MKLLTLGNPKTAKGEDSGYLTGILMLAPYNMSGYQVCPKASEGCSKACLMFAGRGRFPKIQDARIRKTKMWFEDRQTFKAQMVKDIEALVRKADREEKIPAVRLNGLSDIPWENVWPEIFENFSDVQFYDYTKRPARNTPDNYHLTFSLSESNEDEAAAEFLRGTNVAVVFRDVPGEFWNAPVIDGDTNDLRFLDPNRVIVGLKAKGLAKKDESGFVR